MFSHQVSRLQFPKDVHFGDETEIWLSKAADVIDTVYLRVQWPPLSSGVDDSVGTRMIDFVELVYEDQLIERHYGESLELLNDLTVPQAKQGVLTQLLGKNTTSNLSSYYVRMPFSIKLPICALRTHPRLRIKFRPSTDFTSGTLNYVDPINVDLFVNYIYLPEAERERYRNGTFDYMTRTIQRAQLGIGPNTTNISVYTNFVGSVNELYWVIQNDGSSAYNYTNLGAEQLVSLRLTFNNNDVIPVELGTPLFLRSTQALIYHTRKPDRNFYFYSFGLDPEEAQPTGQINMSSISSQIHNLTLSPCAYSRQIRIYARTNSVVRVEQGNLRVVSDTVKEGGVLSVLNKYLYSPQYTGLYPFVPSTIVFSTLGYYGSLGPLSTEEYGGAPWSASQFKITNGIQQLTIPTTGRYRIVASGGFGTVAGRLIQGIVTLAQGQILNILVGQNPTSTDTAVKGGAGASYVVYNGVPLFVAAGGDSGTGAVPALGFSVPGSGQGNDGAGFYTDGASLDADNPYLKPRAYVNGGFGCEYFGGGQQESGGFGGGQAPKTSGISGGGGYTGSSGSGATSYVNPTLVTNAVDLGASTNGYVSLTLL